MASDILEGDDDTSSLEYFDKGHDINPYYIEENLKKLCNDDNHPMLQGGQFFQPGFTLFFTMLVLVGFVAGRRLLKVVRILFPQQPNNRADGLVVAASELSYSDQHGLLLRLNDAIPSMAKAFPEGDFVGASYRIANRDLETTKEQCWRMHSARSKHSDSIDKQERGTVHHEVNEFHDDFTYHLSAEERLRNAISNLMPVENIDYIEHIINAIPLAAQKDLFQKIQKVPKMIESTSETQKGKPWEVWRDLAGDDILLTMIDEIEKWMDARHEIADRDTALIFLFLEVLVGLWVLVEYLSFQVPEGHWFFCKIPFLISVVSYKPFSIPMWACITIICPYTFAENVFGHHRKGRNPCGTCLGSSLPRNAYSIGLVFIVTTLLISWCALAILTYGIPLIVFSPILGLPAFVIPFVTLYATIKPLDCVVSRAIGKRSSRKNGDPFNIGDRVEVCSGEDEFQKGTVKSLLSCGRPIVVPDLHDPREGQVWDRCRHVTPVAFELYSDFEETVFALRLAATQLILAVMFSLPLIQFFRGTYGWARGANDVLGVITNVPSLVVSLQWPVFHLPRFHVQFVAGFALVAFQGFLRSGEFIIRSTRPNPILMLRFAPSGSSKERCLAFIFSLVSWLPFRVAMMRMKSAFEGAHLVAKRNFGPNDMGNSFEHQVQTIFYCVGIFTCWFPFQASSSRKDLNVKEFPKNARNSDLLKFCSSEMALWHSGIQCANNPLITQVLPWAYQCIWFKVLRIVNCRHAEGDLAAICEWLVDLTHLEIGRSTEDSKFGIRMERKEELEVQSTGRHTTVPWFVGNIYCLKDLKQLCVLNLSTSRVKGDIAVLKHLSNLRLLNMAECSGIYGSIDILNEALYLEVCLLGSTNVYGDISCFSIISSLLGIDLGNTNVSGSIEVFHNTPSLVALDLHGTNVTGSIACFEDTPSLQSVDLDGIRGIFGPISVFSGTHNLRALGLSGTSCFGDIDVFRFTPKLRVLRLAMTAASHSTEVPSRSSKDSFVRRLDSNKVYGSIAVFENLIQLRALNLHATLCHGDLNAFKHTTKIHSINLNGTRISGDCLVFGKLLWLQNVNIWRTGAYGTLSDFEELPRLKSLVVGQTRVDVGIGAATFRLSNPECLLVV